MLLSLKPPTVPLRNDVGVGVGSPDRTDTFVAMALLVEPRNLDTDVVGVIDPAQGTVLNSVYVNLYEVQLITVGAGFVCDETLT